MTTERAHDEPPYWNDTRELTTLVVDRSERLVHMRSHIALERYGGSGSETLFPLREKTGERTYVQSRLFFHAPEGSSREQRLADSQAWWYPAERAIVLWELIPASPLAWRPGPRPSGRLRAALPLVSLRALSARPLSCGAAVLDDLGRRVYAAGLGRLSPHGGLRTHSAGGLQQAGTAVTRVLRRTGRAYALSIYGRTRPTP